MMHGPRSSHSASDRDKPGPICYERPRKPGPLLLLIIFDCDGVLVDSEIICARIDADHLTRAGYPITAEDISRRFAGLTGRHIFRLIEEEMGRALPPTLFDEVQVEIGHRLTEEVEAIAGIAEFLERHGGEVCICSNSGARSLEAMLRKTGLFDHFHPRIFSAVDTPGCRPKPAPDIYLHAARELGAKPEDAIVVEDSSHGVLAARAAGMRVIGFTGGGHTWPGHADALTEAGAETVIRRHQDLPAVIAAMEAWDGVV
jgi:HAD superfamily hydrolase (TIGR01509 family)